MRKFTLNILGTAPQICEIGWGNSKMRDSISLVPCGSTVFLITAGKWRDIWNNCICKQWFSWIYLLVQLSLLHNQDFKVFLYHFNGSRLNPGHLGHRQKVSTLTVFGSLGIPTNCNCDIQLSQYQNVCWEGLYTRRFARLYAYAVGFSSF